MDNRTFMHLAAYRGSVVNGTFNTPIAGVQDNILTKDAAGNFLAPSGAVIGLGIAGGVNASRARINTASLREVGLPYIAPLNTGIVVPSPPNLAYYGNYGPMPRAADSVSVESTHTDVAPQIQFAGLWFQFGRKEPTPGKEYRVRFTGTIAAVVGSWASGAIVLDQVLPSGIYQIRGMDVFGTNLLLARLIFMGGGWRPGVLGRNAVGSVPHDCFLDGRLGVLGEFNSVAMPQLEIYAEAANAAQEGYLDITKIGDYTPLGT